MRPSSAFTRARLWLLVLIGVSVIAAPLAFAGQTSSSRGAYRLHLASHAATPAKKAPVGQVFGGKTSKGWPVVVEVSKDGKKVVQALAGVEMPCTSGMSVMIPDSYPRLPLSKKGAFSATFGPLQLGTTPDGQKIMGQGAITGSRNAAATKMKGTWKLTLTMVDAAGATADTCDSGAVTWTAKQ
jgi:hypothetical protein